MPASAAPVFPRSFSFSFRNPTRFLFCCKNVKKINLLIFYKAFNRILALYHGDCKYFLRLFHMVFSDSFVNFFTFPIQITTFFKQISFYFLFSSTKYFQKGFRSLFYSRSKWSAFCTCLCPFMHKILLQLTAVFYSYMRQRMFLACFTDSSFPCFLSPLRSRFMHIYSYHSIDSVKCGFTKKRIHIDMTWIPVSCVSCVSCVSFILLFLVFLLFLKFSFLFLVFLYYLFLVFLFCFYFSFFVFLLLLYFAASLAYFRCSS